MESTSSSAKKFKGGKPLLVTLALVATASVAGNVLLFYRYSSARPILHIGAEAITRKQYQDTLDFMHGEQVLTKLVLDKIILQAAKKAGLSPSEQEIDQRIAGIERVRPQDLGPARNDKESMQQIRETLRIQIALENLRLQGVSVSDAEVADFYARNRGAFARPTQMETTLALAKNAVQAELAAEMMRKRIDTNTISRQPNIRVAGVNWQPDWSSFPAGPRQQLMARINAMSPGTTNVISISDGKSTLYFAVRANKRRSGGVPALSDIRDQVARSLRLNKALSVRDTVARLYREANVTFDVEKYASYFERIERHLDDKTAAAGQPVASAR